MEEATPWGQSESVSAGTKQTHDQIPITAQSEDLTGKLPDAEVLLQKGGILL